MRSIIRRTALVFIGVVIVVVACRASTLGVDRPSSDASARAARLGKALRPSGEHLRLVFGRDTAQLIENCRGAVRE